MRRALFVLKLSEMFLSLFCTTIHIMGFSNHLEPLPHKLVFCGTFLGYFLISLYGCIAIVLGSNVSIVLEALQTIAGFILFLFTSMFTMYYAENDYHLMYLSDMEEELHPFYYLSRLQSILSMMESFLFLVHGSLMLDIMLVKGNGIPATANMTAAEEDVQTTEPLVLNYSCETLNNCCYNIFCKNCCPNISLHEGEMIGV